MECGVWNGIWNMEWKGNVIWNAHVESIHGIRFREYYHDAWPTLQEFADEGLISMDSKIISLNETGRLFMRNVAMPFDRYMNSSSTTQFSKTV